MRLLQVCTVEQAQEQARTLLAPLLRWEKVPLADAAGRVLAQDVTAARDLPHFTRSMVDGYAVLSRDTAGAEENTPVFLRQVESIAMGQPARGTLVSGQCAAVPTGAMLPVGADAVVMMEYCDALADGTIVVGTSVAVGQHIVRAAEELAAGEVLLHRGVCLHAPRIGALCAAGVTEVPVFAPLRVSLFSTGDELVEPAVVPAVGQMRDVNTGMLRAELAASGMTLVRSATLRDDAARMRSVLAAALADSDLVVVSGGSSQGQKDATAQIFGEIAHPGVLVHGLALQPGKPTILASDVSTGTVLVGLPGHPVAALLVFRQVIGEAVRELTGQPLPWFCRAQLTENIANPHGRTVLQPVRLENATAVPVHGKSGLIVSLTRADGYFKLERDCEGKRAGDWVEVFPL